MSDVRTIKFIYYKHINIPLQKTEDRSLVEGESYTVNYIEYPHYHKSLLMRVLENGKIVTGAIIAIKGFAYTKPIKSMSGKIIELRMDDRIDITTNMYDKEGMNIVERIKISTPEEWKTIR